jgi:hypothetical protein
MSFVKNNPDFNLYYSDTDSAIIDQPLPANMVGNELGLFKLEYEINRYVSLAPKVYGFMTTNGNKVIKIKGVSEALSKDVSLPELESLLFKDNHIQFKQIKWFKNVMIGDITINEVLYHLRVTSNKREAIYIEYPYTYKNVTMTQSVFTATKPFNYSDIESDK